MLLKEYLLLNLGQVTPAEARAWERDMTARRQVDASRDLLAFWRPKAEEEGYRPGQVVAVPIVSLKRFGGDMTEAEFRTRLDEAVQRTLQHFQAGPAAAQVKAVAQAGVAVGEVVLTLPNRLPAVVSNGFAYHFEEAFGYAQASKHPVAYEESLRPTT